uniref:Uncharacterized protein n=1 Tax=Rhizophora mucronata TaxID=61149 RepID=A0A2P2N5C3_RHIMU
MPSPQKVSVFCPETRIIYAQTLLHQLKSSNKEIDSQRNQPKDEKETKFTCMGQ